MLHFRRILFVTLLSILAFSADAQNFAAVDSMKRGLAIAKTPEEKIYWMDHLARTIANINPAQGDSIGRVMIEFAEESRDRKLMVKAYASNGLRTSYFAGNLAKAKEAIAFYEKALSIARDNKLEEEIGWLQLRLSSVYLTIPDKEKAFAYVNQASSIISMLKNDSLRAECQHVFGNVYLARNEKILALRSYLNGLRIAEISGNIPMIRSGYLNISRFYSTIEAYDKAIDYAMLAYKLLDQIKDQNVAYQRVVETTRIGNLYSYKKSYEIAISYMERSIRMADSLKFSSLKMPGYMSLFNQYLRMNEPSKALEFFNSPRGHALQEQLSTFGMGAEIAHGYAITYSLLGKFDSARVNFVRATPYFKNSSNLGNKMFFFFNLGQFYKKTGENDSAIHYFRQVKEMGDQLGSLENVEQAAKELDTLYAAKGDIKLSREFYGIYHKYKDSIEFLGKEKELTQEEAADEQQRELRRTAEREERQRRRNNIQYMFITFGIVLVFISLVILGMFKVSAGFIRAVGFFAFLLFLEFIFLIFKKNIYSITHGEPWKDLAFMIGLAALLVPLHHWIERECFIILLRTTG